MTVKDPREFMFEKYHKQVHLFFNKQFHFWG